VACVCIRCVVSDYVAERSGVRAKLPQICLILSGWSGMSCGAFVLRLSRP